MSLIGQTGYILSTLGFITGMIFMNNPARAGKGNFLMIIAAILAIISTLVLQVDLRIDYQWKSVLLIMILLIVGSVIGSKLTNRFRITQMPELVSIFNGFGGLSAALIALFGLIINHSMAGGFEKAILTSTLFLGLMTFSGSLVAFSKLRGNFKFRLKLSRSLSALTFLLSIGVITLIVATPSNTAFISELVLLVIFSLMHGLYFSSNIGSGDMPVLISGLNGLTGVVTAITGIYFTNTLLILLGVFVGFTGVVLTFQMSKAMNRSLIRVLFKENINSSVETTKYEKIEEIHPAQIASDLKLSQRVAIVPGFGLAVAQAQQLCNELRLQLIEEGVDFKFIIHPVAGRMPGHMNVLLAEAQVEYDDILDLKKGNEFLNSVDYCLVIGANDVVNTSAENDPNSPIYGMPIVQCSRAKKIIVIKRSLDSGYAGIKNPLFEEAHCKLFLSDAKLGLGDIINQLKIE